MFLIYKGFRNISSQDKHDHYFITVHISMLHNDCYSYLAAGMTAILQRWEGVKTEVLKNYDNPANMVNRFDKPARVKIGKL